MMLSQKTHYWDFKHTTPPRVAFCGKKGVGNKDNFMSNVSPIDLNIFDMCQECLNHPVVQMELLAKTEL